MPGDWKEHDPSDLPTHLPPPEFWTFNPLTDEPYNTPLDGRGFVDLNGLLDIMNQTVDPAYDWKSPFADVHHLQWPNRWYNPTDGGSINPQEFRNHATSKIKVPRIYHNWLHLVTLPPKMPDEEAIRLQIEALKTADKLRGFVDYPRYLARKAERNKKGVLMGQLARRMNSFQSLLETAKDGPPEFQVIDYSGLEVQHIEDMLAIGRLLSKRAISASPVRLVLSSPSTQEIPVAA